MVSGTQWFTEVELILSDVCITFIIVSEKERSEGSRPQIAIEHSHSVLGGAQVFSGRRISKQIESVVC